MKKKKRVLVDFDNTLVNSGKTIYNLFWFTHKDKVAYHINNYKDEELLWDFSNFAKTKEDQQWCVDRFKEQRFYDELELIDGAKESLEELHNMGYETIICSKKCKYSMEMAYTWIENHLEKGIHYDEIIFVSDFHVKGLINCDIVIDDKYECLEGFSNDVLKIWFGWYGYNQNKECLPLRDDIVSYLCVDWNEVLEEIKEYDVENM